MGLCNLRFLIAVPNVQRFGADCLHRYDGYDIRDGRRLKLRVGSIPGKEVAQLRHTPGCESLVNLRRRQERQPDFFRKGSGELANTA